LKKHWLMALMFSAAPALAQSLPPPDTDGSIDTTLPVPKRPLQRYASDPFAKMDRRAALAAADTRATPELARALRQLEVLRQRDRTLDVETSLAVVNANLDEDGVLNVRFRQTYAGVPVRNGGFISHLSRDGSYEDFDFLKRSIALNVAPRVDSTRAVALVAALPNHTLPYAWDPRAELQIHPVYQRLLDDTGRPAPTPPLDPAAPDAVPDYNAERVPRTVASYRLVWRIQTLEGVERGFGPHQELESIVDANTGELVSQRALSSDATGTGPNVGTVQVVTTQSSPGQFQMIDVARNFRTMDDDFDDDEGPNLDFDNVWGSSALFPLNGAGTGTKANRQSAMVDVHHHARVFWDFQKNVFKRSGTDNNFAETNNWVHDGTAVNNAGYKWWTGNISYGDGPAMQTVDVVAHEHGHAFQHDTNGLGGDVDESIADIWGSMTRLFLESGKFAAQSTSLPATLARSVSPSSAVNAFVRRSGRDMQKPSRQGDPDMFFPSIDSVEIHSRGGPNNRAFYFLSQGASCRMGDADFSPLLPWGMAGVGPDAATRIWAHAMINDMPDGPDYLETRAAIITGAKHVFGVGASQVDQARNAYAGINVGALASTYPAAPVASPVIEPNNTSATAQVLTRPGNKPVGCPDKRTIVGAGTTEDWFQIQVPAGQPFAVQLQVSFGGPMTVAVFDGATTVIPASAVGNFKSQVFPATASGLGLRTLKVRVRNSTPGAFGLYSLGLDW